MVRREVKHAVQPHAHDSAAVRVLKVMDGAGNEGSKELIGGDFAMQASWQHHVLHVPHHASDMTVSWKVVDM